MGINDKKYSELNTLADKLITDTNMKIVRLQSYLEQAHLKEKVIDAKISTMKQLKLELTEKEKKVKYAKLRLLKLINEKNLDKELKNLVSEAIKECL